jgi:hypothetical protein
MSFAPTFQELSEAFQEHREPADSVLDETAIQAFYDTYQKVIQKNLLEALCQSTSPDIGKILFSFYVPKLEKIEMLRIAAVKSLSSQQAVELTRSFILMVAPDLNGITLKMWNGLAQLGQKSIDNTLTLWAAIFAKDEKLRLKTLKTISKDEYCIALDLLAKPIEPLFIMKREFLPEFFERLSSNQEQVTGDAYFAMLEWIFEWKSEHMLGSTAQLVSRLDNMQLYRVEEMVKKTSGNIAKEFIQAVKVHRKRLGKKPGFIKRILS